MKTILKYLRIYYTERGIDELSKFLEFRYGVKVSRILERNTSVQQKTLDREERLSIMLSSEGGAYSLKKHRNGRNRRKSREDGRSSSSAAGSTQAHLPVPERVVILDDVMTTGATVEGIARLLKENGAKEVMVITIFTVD